MTGPYHAAPPVDAGSLAPFFLPFLALLILAHVSGRALLALSRLANFGTVRGGELLALQRLANPGTCHGGELLA